MLKQLSFYHCLKPEKMRIKEDELLEMASGEENVDIYSFKEKIEQISFSVIS